MSERYRGEYEDSEAARYDAEKAAHDDEMEQREVLALRERVDRLMQIIEAQPHSGRCAVYTSSGYCDCWKSRAEVKG